MKRVIIVQARMTSTRLPGKVVMDVAGRPMLAQQLRRLRRVSRADEIVLATTTLTTDDPVVSLADREGIRWFRGPEHDVLARYLGAGREARAELVVRITADCPLIDPDVVDRVIRELEEGVRSADFASNVLRRTYPRGLDTEALFADVLARVARLAVSPGAREHVTWYLYRERPDLFLGLSVTDSEDHSDLRWTVDTLDDLALIRRLYDDLGLAETVRPYRDILTWVRAHPELARRDTRFAPETHPS